MRIRAEQVLDTIAKQVHRYFKSFCFCFCFFKQNIFNYLVSFQIKDPMIISHWNSLNSPTLSCVKVTIISHGFDFMCRTSLMIQVLQKSFRCICKDGKVMNLSYEAQELRDLILCQVIGCFHLFQVPSRILSSY